VLQRVAVCCSAQEPYTIRVDRYSLPQDPTISVYIYICKYTYVYQDNLYAYVCSAIFVYIYMQIYVCISRDSLAQDPTRRSKRRPFMRIMQVRKNEIKKRKGGFTM